MNESMNKRQPRLKKLSKGTDSRLKRWTAIYSEYTTLIADPRQSRTRAVEYLAEKYGYSRTASIYDIVRRMRSAGNAADRAV